MQLLRTGLALVALLGLCAAPAVAQKDAAASKKPDPEVKEQLKAMQKACGDRRNPDDEKARGIIDELLQKYEDMHPKDQNAMRKALKEVLVSPRIKRKPDNKGLFVAAAVALGRMGADGARILVSAYGNPKFKKSTGEESWVSMRAVFLKEIGRTKDPKQIKFLTDRARRDPNDPIMAAAGRALGYFEDAPLNVRKDIVKDLINKFGEVEGKALASLDPGDAQVKRSKERLAAISEPWNETLQKLTKQNLRTPSEWQNFWNKNKGKNWDK